MAVAKRKQSRSRKNSRRAQWMKVAQPAVNKCPSCGEPRLSHRACPSCGKYGPASEARQVLVIKDKKTESQEQSS